MPLEQIADFSVSYLQVLDENGKLDERLDPKLSDSQLVELYEAMVRGREIDQRMLKMQRQGRMGTIPPCCGQEATACGVALALTEQDWLVGYYREIGARLMRGTSMVSYMQLWNGWEEGNVQQVPGRNLPVAAIIGSHTLHAVGIAYATQYREEKDTAVVTLFGEGATSEGDVHEAFNFAGVWQSPVVFVCQNNQWAISLPRDKQTRSKTIAQKAIAYGFEGIQVDGNDALAVYRATKAALERARSGGGPTLIEALTYRLMMHTTADDPKRYRSDNEVEQWWKRDPIPRLRGYMDKRGVWGARQEEALVKRVKAEVDDAVREFEAKTGLKLDAPFDHVFANPHPSIEAQRRAFLAEQRRRQKSDG